MKKLRIGLMGHSFCCMNLGLGALAISECKIIDDICRKKGIEYEIICFEMAINSPYMECVDNYSVKLETISFKKPFEAIAKLKRCDLIIDITGGDSFSDIYGAKNYTGGMLLKYYSLCAKKPIILAPQTIGPFSNRLSKIAAEIYLNKVKYIFTRDDISKKCLKTKLSERCISTCDVAFILPYQKETYKEERKRRAGFNVSGLLYNESHVKGFSCDYKHLVESVIEVLLKQGYEVVLVPHVVGRMDDSADNDTKVCSDLTKKYPVSMAPLFKNPIEAKSYISGLDLFIGSRMHATIAAVSSKVPAIPLAYSRKFKGVFEPIGYEETIDLTSLDNRRVLEMVKNKLAHVDELKEKSIRGITSAEMRLEKYRDILEQEIDGIIRSE